MKSDSSLLTGSVPKKLAAFALPLFLGNLLQALYNAVDMLVVGRIVGETGLAAISNASMLCYIINSLGLGLTMGGAVLAAQFKGAGDAQGQRDCVSMLLFASLSASVLVTFAGLAACEPVFRALYVPADAYDDACEYMKAICWGTVFVFGYNAVCSALKGLGDSVTPLYIVAAAAVINIALDILFVGPLALGTVGAAYATVAAQGVAFVASLAYLRRREPAFAPGRPAVGAVAGHSEARPAYRRSNGCGERRVSAHDRHAEPVRHRSRRCLRRGSENQHLRRYALLGYRAGDNGDGRPVHWRG